MEGLPSELANFEKQAIQTAIISEYDQDHIPHSGLQPGAPIEFLIEGAPEHYLDLNDSKLELKCKITKENGDNLGDQNHVGPVNLLLHSLFSNIEMEVYRKQVTEPGQLYSLRSYLETLLNFESNTLNTRHLMEGWEKDTSGQLADTDANKGDANEGLRKRAARFKGSKVVTLIGRPHLDLFHQDKLIPGDQDIKIRLLPNNHKWVLKSAAPADRDPQVNYKLEILNARLFIRTKQVSKSLANAHIEMLRKGNNYHIDFTKVSMKQLQIPQGVNTMHFDGVYSGVVPDRVIVCFIRDDALAGSYTLNPFNLEHYNVNYLVLKVNGGQFPRLAFEPDFKKGDYFREYFSTLEALGYHTGQEMIDLKPEEWANGYTFFAFKLTPGPIGQVRSIPKHGSVRLELKFAEPTPRNISAILLAQQPAALEIDKFGNAILP